MKWYNSDTLMMPLGISVILVIIFATIFIVGNDKRVHMQTMIEAGASPMAARCAVMSEPTDGCYRLLGESP